MQKPTIKATVVLLVNADHEVCLAQKRQPIHHDKGEIGYSLGTYNGYGGKQDPEDMTILDTAVRELFDESGVRAEKSDLVLAARVYFYTKKDEEWDPFMEVSFFLLHKWEGEPEEGREMGPSKFFPKDVIPYDDMMPADKIFFKEIFAGKRNVYEIKLLCKNIEPEVRVLEEEL